MFSVGRRLFVFEPSLLRAFGWFGFLATPGRRGHLFEHVAQFGETIGDVASLIAKSLARYDNFTLFRDFVFEAVEKPLPHRFRQTPTLTGIPPKSRFRVNLVDVFATRPLAARKRKLEFAKRDRKLWVHD